MFICWCFLWMRLFLISNQTLTFYWCDLHLLHNSLYILGILIVLILIACSLNSFVNNTLDDTESQSLCVFCVIMHNHDDKNRVIYISNIYFLHLNRVYFIERFQCLHISYLRMPNSNVFNSNVISWAALQKVLFSLLSECWI